MNGQFSDPAWLAEMSARLDPAENDAEIPPALLAAYLDGGLDEAAREQVAALLAASPAAFHDAWSAAAFLENLGSEIAKDKPAGNVTHLRPRAPLPAETFLPLAAATQATTGGALLCRSQSGIWTLEVFVAPDNEEKGYLLLSVHPDHQESYEGRAARVFVTTGNEERLLAEQAVKDGEIYADISLEGLDLHSRDAINVTFGPAL